MNDYVVARAWRASVAMMIFVSGAAALASGYAALFTALDAAWFATAAYLTLAATLAAGTWWLCENQGELIVE